MNPRSSLLPFVLLLVATPVLAHTETASAGGFASGFLHPFGGGDHLLAMVAVGIWGAVLGAPLLWQLPVAFPLLMVLGALAALAFPGLRGVEPGIALSVLVLGAAIAAFWHAGVPAALVVVAAFGFLHGYAHGTELPRSASPAAYACGFVLASGLLHAAGIAVGAVRTLPRGSVVLRVIGGGITLAGAWMLVGRPGLA